MTTVALVAHRLADPAPSGIGRYYRELIVALAQQSGTTRLVAVTPREHQPGIPWLPVGVRRRELPGPRRAVQFGWTTVRRPRVDAWSGGADVVHALHAWAPVPTRLPLVVTVHDLMGVLNPGWQRVDHRWAIREALRHAADRADRIITDSAWVASLVQSRLGVAANRIETIPLGVGDRFRVPPAEDEVQAVERRWGLKAGGYVLAVGQVTDRKNLVSVVRALAALGPEASGRLPLVVAGASGRLPFVAAVPWPAGWAGWAGRTAWTGRAGRAGEALGAEADRLGLSDRVRVLGYVPDGLLVALVAGARVLVHPSLDEGFGLTPLEAMAAGTPVVASRAASLPEVVGGAGVLVEPTDADAWAQALGRVIGDEDERDRLIAAGRRRQVAFTWAATGQATLGVYQEVLRARQAS